MQCFYLLNLRGTKLFTLSLSLILISFLTNAQTGPGGVEDYIASSNLKIWVSADSITGLSGGSAVSNWGDRSAENNDGTQASGTEQPLYETNQINGLPALSFDGGDFVDFTSPSISGSTFDYYVVVKANSITATGTPTDGAGNYILDRTVSGNPLVSLKATPGDFYTFQKRDDSGTIGGATSTTTISTTDFQVVSIGRTGTDYIINVDGTAEDTLVTSDGVLTPNPPRLGRHQSNAVDGGLDGLIAEFIVFDKYLNEAERILLNNYLAAKYNLTITNDFYAFESTHPNEVSGIGQVSGANQISANSSLLFQINGATGLDDDEFAIFGHDGGDINSWTATEIPCCTDNIERIAREWVLDKNGNDLGDITFQIDSNQLSMPNYDSLALLVDADGDFTSGASTFILTDQGGGIYSAALDNSEVPDGSYLSVAALDPTIQFTTDSTGGFESSDASLTIALNYTPTADVMVTYSTADGSAEDENGDNDYTSASTQATISALNNTTGISITIIDDGTPENTEDFTVSLSAPTDGSTLGTNATATYSILDNENTRKASFVTASSSGGEASKSTVFVSTQISSVDLVDDVEIVYTATGGTATNGVDYSLSTDTVTIPSGATQGVFSFSVNDDAFDESDETVVISLIDVIGNASLSETPGDLTFTYTITNDDNVPTLQFTSVSSSGDESITPVSVPLDLSATSEGTISVDYIVSGLALSGTDHTLSDGTLEITSGNIGGTINFSVEDDTIPESIEDIIITLNNPSGATFGNDTVFTYSIEDNDDFGFTGPGGVGSTTINRLWLRVEGTGTNLFTTVGGSTNPTNGQSIERWEDISGNSNNVTEATNEPTYTENALNGKGVATFAGNNYLDAPDLQISSSTSGYNYFVVTKVNSTPDQGEMDDGQGDFILDRTSATTELVSLKVTDDDGVGNNGPNRYGFQKRTNAGNALGGPISSTDISLDNFEILSLSRLRIDANNADYFLHIDGTLEGSETGNPNEGETTPPNPRIGRHATNANNGLQGDIAEFIVFSSYLNDTRRILVENYLSSRYGLPIADDRYTHDVNFGEDVAGIGQEGTDSDDFHLRAQSSGILTIENASSLDDGDYMLFGHNDGDTTSWSASDVPDASFERLGRVWQFDETNDIGTIDLTFDTVNLPDIPSGFTDYYLLVDDDNDFSNGILSQTLLTESGSDRIASGVDIADDSYVTIAVRNELLINFANTTISVGEDDSNPTISVLLPEIPSSDVTVEFVVTGGDAVGGGPPNDFGITGSSLTFMSGMDSVQNIDLSINDDSEVELDETITIALRNPNTGALGPDSLLTITINDNDNDGFTGPAGVGDASNNVLWISADSITVAGGEPGDGMDVTEWVDLSGNANSFFQNTEMDDDPVYVLSGQNGLPVVRFNGDDALEAPDVISGNTGRTIFTVGFSNSAPQTANYYLELNKDRTGGSGESYLLTMETAVRVSGNIVYDQSFGQTDYRLFTVRNATGDNVTDTEAYLEGASLGTSTSSAASINTLTTGTYLGGFTGSPTFDGDIAEIIIFDQELNEAQRIIIENYLHTKWGLANTLTDDRYVFDASYGNEVAGIGRASDGSFHSSAQSSDLLGISNASSLDAGDFLLFGHDNGDTTTWVTTETPGDSIFRIAREWRLDETGDLGTVTISVDTANLPPLPAGFTEYVVWVDDDGDFSSGATQLPMSLGSGSFYESEGTVIDDSVFVTFGVFKPVVQFQNLTQEGSEADTLVDLTLTLNYALAEEVSVQFDTLAAGTADDTDHGLSTGIATFSTGSTSTNITLDVIDDMVEESSENIIVALSNLSNGELGSNDTLTYVISDDDSDRTIDFAVSSSSGSEGNSPAFITVRLSEIDAVEDTEVIYQVTGGDATGGGVDFTLETDTVTVPANNLTTTFPISINDDAVGETNESIEITLSDPSNANLGTNTVHTFTILDDDESLEANFTLTSTGASEAAGTVGIEVNLNEIAASTITINYEITGGTATGGGTDFTSPNDSIQITSGNAVGDISIVLNDDGDVEGGETIIIELTSATGAIIGDDSVVTFSISDNDNDGFTGPAGVGDASNNVLWISADSITAAGGEPADMSGISDWIDLSGNGNDFTTDTGSPTYDSTGINDLPIVRFDGDDGMNASDIISGNVGRTIFAVTKQNVSSGTSPFDGDADEASYFLEFNEDRSGTTGESYLVTNEPAIRVSGNQIYDTNPGLTNFRLLSFRNAIGDSVGAVEAYLEGTQLGKSSTSNGTTTMNTLTGGTYLGGFGNASATFQGDIAEIIVYDQELNDAQRIIIENYLHTRYDLDSALENDYYNFDAGHPFDLAGIGRVDASNQHLAAQSAGILTISSPSAINDGDFLLFGHDGGNASSWSTSDVPDNDTNIQRLAREWRIDTDQNGSDGDMGTVTVNVDTSELAGFPSGYDNVFLLVDDNGLFSEGATFVPLTAQGNNTFEAAGVNISDNSYLTIAVVRQEISFTLSSSSIVESNGPASIEVSTNIASANDITVDYNITGGTAQAADFSVDSMATLTITAGNLSTNISVGLINDSEGESTEAIEFTLSNPSGAQLGSALVHTLSIDDDDQSREIDFSTISASGDESEDSVEVIVQVSFVDNFNPTTVDYAVSVTSTATGSSIDYTLASGTATVDATFSTDTIVILVNEDILLEDDETIILELTNPDNASLGDNTTFTYTINDNDVEPTIQFTDTLPSGSESVSPAAIEVSLSTFSGLDATVDYQITPGGTATEGVDFSLSSGTLSISAGSESGNILPVIFDDSDIEGGETFEITLSNAQGATLGDDSVALFTISDDDNDGFTGPGGVGDANNNVLWVKADSVTSGSNEPSNNDPVNVWVDASGNSNGFSVATGSPTYVSNGLNSLPIVRFDGDDGLQAPDIISGNGGRTIFSVVLQNASTGTSPFDGDADEASYFLELNQDRSGGTGESYLLTTEPAIRVSGNIIFDTNPGLGNYSLLTYRNAGGSQIQNLEGFLDGATLGTSSTSNGTSTIDTDGGGTYLGGFGTSNTTFDGDIAEIIVYNVELNDAQRIIIENYLAAKYDLTISNSKFSNGTFNNDVAGVGQVNSEQHTAAQSAGILSISSPSALDDDDFILFGHNDASVDAWTTNEAPSSGQNIRRLTREWLVEVSNTPGNVTIGIDTADLPLAPSGFDKYFVMVDSDGDFSDGNTELFPTTLTAGDLYEASGISLTNNDFIAIAIVRSVVEFTSTASSEFEPDGPAVIEVSSNFELSEDVSVDFEVTGGTATGGGIDYTRDDGTVTITAGNTTANIQVFLTNDTDGTESDETVELTLTDVSTNNAQIGPNNPHIFTIQDDDNLRKIFFESDSTGGSESLTSDTVVVRLTDTQIDPDNVTSVDVSVAASSEATEGADFTFSPTTVDIPINEDSSAFIITFIDDGTDEDDETIVFELSNPINGNLADPMNNPIEFKYTIVDNDAEPTIAFVDDTVTVAEDAGSAELTLALSNRSGQDVSVDYTISGTATQGDDYLFDAGTANIIAGDSTANLIVTLTDDSDVEGAETLIVTLTPATGVNATIDSPDEITLFIIDDDNDGFTGPAGVGDASNNVLWIRSDSVTAANGEPGGGADVTEWVDLSGNGNNIFQNVDGNDDPIYVASAINGLPAISFDGDDVLEGPSILSGNIGRTVFVIAKADDVTPGDPATYLFDLDKDRNSTGVGYLLTTEVAVRVNGNRIYNESFGTIDFRLLSVNNATGASASQIDARLEGAALTESSLSDATLNTDNTGIKIGGIQTNASFEGDISEIIVYNVELNEAQRIIIENYLHAKYQLPNALSIDVFDESQGVSYEHDVAGIGRRNNEEHTAAQSAGLLTIDGPIDLQNDEYLLFGHDNQDDSLWITTDRPNTSVQRITREWFIDQTGDVGTITVRLADASKLQDQPTGFDSYILLVDEDGDANFSDATIIPLTNTSGDEFEAGNVDLPDGSVVTFGVIENVTDGGTGDFSDPNSWTSLIVPGAGQVANIVAGDSIGLSEDVTIAQLIIGNNAKFNLNGFNLTLDTDSIQLGSGAEFITSNGTVTYAASGSQEVSSLNYHNLEISGSGTKTLLGDIDVDGDLTINSTLDVTSANNYTINLAGNLDNNGTFQAQNGAVIVDGSSDQQFDGDFTLFDLTIDKSSGALNLNTSFTISSTLSMTSGNIILGNFDLTLGTSGMISGGSASSYIQADGIGTVIKELDCASGLPLTQFKFAIGDASGDYTPFYLDLATATCGGSPNISINLDDVINPNINTNGAHITRYWTVTESNISSFTGFNIYYKYASAGDVEFNEDNLVPIKFDDIGDVAADTSGLTKGVDYDVDTAEDSIYFLNLSNFCEVTAGVDEDIVILPVELLFFRGSSDEGIVNLEWATATEIDNDFFEIQRSETGEKFEVVGIVDGSGNSDELIEYKFTDVRPLSGNNFYRLKQVDFDGAFEYSDIIRVENELEGIEFTVNIYPNPTEKREFNLDITTPNLNAPITIEVLDAFGKVKANQSVVLDKASGVIQFILPESTTNGLYIVRVLQNERLVLEKLIVR